jgi:hypothetical protein
LTIDDIKQKVEEKIVDPATEGVDAISCALTLIKVQRPAPEILERLSKTRAKQAFAAIQAYSRSGTVFELLERLSSRVVESLVAFIQGYSVHLLPFSQLV